MPKRPEDQIPDVRDGLTRVERILLVELAKLQQERPGRPVPTAMLYGRLIEAGLELSPKELAELLAKLVKR